MLISSAQIREENVFDIDGDVLYFDNAGRSPLPVASKAKAIEAIEWKAQPWKPDRANAASVDALRQMYAELIHADSGKDIAIMNCTSNAMSIAAENILRSGVLTAGKCIVIAQDQMASNVYCWQNACLRSGAHLCVVPRPWDGNWTDAVLETLEEQREQVAVVALPPCHWCDGSKFNLQQIGDKCRELQKPKIYFIIDATQAVGAVPLNVRELRPDFMAASVHKWLLCPYGMSLVYLHPEHQRNWTCMDQHERNRLGADNPVWDEEGAMKEDGYPLEYVLGASRLDVGGKPNPSIVLPALVSLEMIVKWTPEMILQRLQIISRKIAEAAERAGFFVVPEEYRVGHFIGIKHEIYSSPQVSQYLLNRKRKIVTSVRCGWVRISPYIFNTDVDVAALCEALESIRHTKL